MQTEPWVVGGTVRTRRDELAGRLTAALDRPGGGWVLVEGPAGSGASTALRHVAALAGARGLTAAAWTLGTPPPRGVAEARVICLEEAHRLDGDALAALPAGALVVAAPRAGADAAEPAVLAGVRADPATVRLALAPLEADDAARRLPAGADPALALEALALAGGNARLLDVVLRHAPDGTTAGDGGLARAAGAAAAGEEVAAWCRSRTAGLVPAAGAVLDALVALGDEAPLWLVSATADLDPRAAAGGADALVAAGLLRAADPALRAVPGLWRALEAHDRDRAARAQLRRRAAARLAATGRDVDQAGELLLATPVVGEPWAPEALREAAAAAAEPERARELLGRALEEPVERGLRSTLLLELAAVHDGHDAASAEEARRVALRLAPEDRRPAIHLALGRTRFGAGDYSGAADELERGLEGVGAEDPLRTELVAAYVAAARFDGTLQDPAARHLEPVLDREEPGRTAAERALLAEIALERGIRGSPCATVVDLALRAWAGGRILAETDPHGIAVSQLVAALTWSDAFADSRRVLDATVAHGEAHDLPLLAATARYLRAWPHLYAGALDAAEADVRAALATPGWEMYEPAAHAVLGHVLIERGAPDAARATLAVPDAERWRSTVPYALLLETRARLHAADGALAAAAADLREVGALLDSIGNRSPFCPWRSRLGVVLARGGDLDAGRALVAEELAQADATGTPRARGVALRARARLAVLADEVGHGEREDGAGGADAGLADLEAAVAALAGCGARLDHVGALTDRGVALARAGRRPEARQSLREAEALARDLGAREAEERAARELHRAGGRHARGVPGAPAGLTASELRVARLAARGRTNREIADDLVVSTHTVRFHLTGAYRKLGVGDRAALAAVLDVPPDPVARPSVEGTSVPAPAAEGDPRP